MPFLRSISIVLLACLVMACGSTAQAPVRYLLPQVEEGIPSPSPSQTLVLQPLRLADYLQGPGLVMQVDELSLHQANQHLWAENLADQLQRQLRQHLNRELPDTRVLQATVSPEPSPQLRLMVERFQGHYHGHALVSGLWQLLDESGRVLRQEPFLEQVPLASDGYPALVRALGQGWHDSVNKIAETLANLP